MVSLINKFKFMMDIRKYFGLYIIFLLSVTIVSSCKKNNFNDHIGPALCPTANFQFVQQPTMNNTSFNLQTDTVKLTASFNEQVPWTITIKGSISQSFKKFSGYGSSINVNWIGNPDTLDFFQVEQCTAEFKIACKDPISQTFNITGVNKFTNFNYLAFNGDGGALGLLYGPPYGYSNPGTSTTMVAGLNSPQGGNCLCTHGTSTTPVYYFGGFDLNITGNLSSHVLTDPSKVYFNCFVNVQGSQNTIPVVVFTEGVVKRSKNILVYGDGWHYVSFPLSDANVVNPQDISVTSFTLNGYPNKATAGDMCLDFVSFTNNSPFINTTTK
jgi:hypothetical protein